MAIVRTGPNGAIRMTLALEGADELSVALSRFGTDVDDWRPFWRDHLAPRFFGDVQRNFDQQGALSGGRWRALSEPYRTWKERHYPGRLILERTLRLRKSLTWNSGSFSPGGGRGNLGRDGIYRPDRQSVDLGTAVPYARYHQLGVGGGRRSRALPQRRFLFAVGATVYGRLMHQWLVSLTAGIRGNRYGTTGVSGGGQAFTA